MATNERPILDFKYCLNPYYGAISKFYSTGDIRDLAKLVREIDIPQPFKETIALILLGDVTHNKLSKGIAKSHDKLKVYNRLIAGVVPIWSDMLKDLIASGDLPADRLKYCEPRYGRKYIIQSFADEFYKSHDEATGNYSTAERIISRKIRVEGWKPLPDF